MKEWTGKGTWDGWSIENDRLVSPTGRAFGPDDIEPLMYTQSDLARALGVSRAAIADRVRRSEKARANGRESSATLPPFDEPGVWHRETIKKFIK